MRLCIIFLSTHILYSNLILLTKKVINATDCLAIHASFCCKLFDCIWKGSDNIMIINYIPLLICRNIPFELEDIHFDMPFNLWSHVIHWLLYTAYIHIMKCHIPYVIITKAYALINYSWCAVCTTLTSFIPFKVISIPPDIIYTLYVA